MTPVFGLAALILELTWMLIVPTSALSSSTVLPPPPGSVGSVASLTRVESKPAVARASIVATLEFLGKLDDASRALPSNSTVYSLSAARSWLASTGVPYHDAGGLSCVTVTVGFGSASLTHCERELWHNYSQKWMPQAASRSSTKRPLESS